MRWNIVMVSTNRCIEYFHILGQFHDIFRVTEEGIMRFRNCALMGIAVTLCAAFFCRSNAQEDTEFKFERRFTGMGYAICGSCTVPAKISSAVWLVKNDEPGDSIRLSGTIFKADGSTPDSGVTLFLYQADAGGYYHRPKEDVFHPRIFGWLRTGNDGHYEIHTVKPSPEILAPREPAHIHVHIFGSGMEEHFLHEFWFEGDTNISSKDIRKFSILGSFSPLISLTKSENGCWTGFRDIRVRPAPHWRHEKD